MHKSATKCNETVGKWCKNKHGASKIIDMFETYQVPSASTRIFLRVVDTDTYQQSASMCVYQATQDGSQGLTFVIYFNHGIQVSSR
jgi:hypothetical protein